MSADQIEKPADGWLPTPGVVAAEMAVAGAAIQSKAALEEAAEHVTADDFFGATRTVYAAACSLADNGLPVDPAAVLDRLAASGDLARVGGGPYLHTLMQHAAPDGSVGYHARRVAEDARRRRIHLALHRSLQISENEAWDDDADPDQIRKLIDEAAVRSGDRVEFDVSGEMAALLDDMENPPPAPAGVVPPFQDLAHLLTSMQAGQVIVVGARPSVGKSTLAVDFMRKAAIRDGQLAVMFTLEMRRREVLQRMASAEAGVSLHAIRANAVVEQDLERLVDAAARISGAPLIIDDRSGCGLEHVRSTLRSLSRRGPIGLVVIDYLQLMSPPKVPNREQEVAALSRGLKLLAGEFEVPIVLLSQLNREAEKRQDRRPQPSDLRESGAVEQDADVIILLHREDAYDRESARAGEADLIVAKNRNGPTGTITVAHQLHYSRFVDMAWSPTRGIS
ncbi:replicative DNA helicase [Nonomuraea sp. NPDC023979]|uniref:replicative DNA helicase n=1 Tax=Nonomuraea sp. NPDC023979 TaxID=3154796 RepID=UPI0033C89587